MLHNLTIQPLTMEDAQDVFHFVITNKDFLRPFEPVREEKFYTFAFQQEALAQAIREEREGKAYSFGVYLTDSHTLIGHIRLFNVVRGGFQNAYMGYSIDHNHLGHGYASRAVHLACRFAFEEAHLHRIQANVMPHNIASIRVLERNHFRYEGLAKRYLCINGKWEDHHLYAITQEEWLAIDNN